MKFETEGVEAIESVVPVIDLTSQRSQYFSPKCSSTLKWKYQAINLANTIVYTAMPCSVVHCILKNIINVGRQHHKKVD